MTGASTHVVCFSRLPKTQPSKKTHRSWEWSPGKRRFLFFTASRFQEPNTGCVSFVFSTWSSMASSTSSRWWFQTFFYFHPYLGKIPNFTNIFQMGWNHQLVNFFDLWLCPCHSSTRRSLSIMHPTLRFQESKDLQEHPWENTTILKISSFLLNKISTIRSWKKPFFWFP